MVTIDLLENMIENKIAHCKIKSGMAAYSPKNTVGSAPAVEEDSTYKKRT